MNSNPYLLFDAGGTLVFPDQDFLIETSKSCGIHLTHKQLFDGYYRLIYQLDWQASIDGCFPKDPWPNGYTAALFEYGIYGLNINRTNVDALITLANARHKNKSLWTFTFPWIHEILAFLRKEGYRMSVISNSDGRTKKIFRDLNLCQYFEHVFDSEEMGVEKPDPEIFEIALNSIGVDDPARVVYIGDIFNVDVKGANLAGIGAVHLDPLRQYKHFPGFHFAKLAQLKTFLPLYTESPQRFTANLIPFCTNNIRSVVREYRAHGVDDCVRSRKYFFENVICLLTVA